MKILKILELTNYSAGVCGVWQRAIQESKEFSKLGFVVSVFSSDAIKGSDSKASSNEVIEGVNVLRFPYKKLGGESFMKWDFFEPAIEFCPDIIIAHSYRHLHTTQALKVRDELLKQGKLCKVLLVTHAPFIEKDFSRSFLAKLSVNLYDSSIGKKNLNSFDRIITIANWELVHFKKLGIKDDSIYYIPNGIPQEFFEVKPNRDIIRDVLFLGRISPVKNLDILIDVAKELNDVKFSIIGFPEDDYLIHLKERSKGLPNIEINGPVLDVYDKINAYDNHLMFVLPSLRESLPQVLIEAMSRQRIVLSSKTKGGTELIIHNKNGFLFDSKDSSELKNIILNNLNGNPRIEKGAYESSKHYSWKLLIKKYIVLFKELGVI